VGLASYVSAGKVTLAYFGIGSNDFKYEATKIYTGSLAGQELDAFVDHVAENFRIALDRVRTAGDVKFVVGTIPNITRTPLSMALFVDADRRQVIDDAVQLANAKLIEIASDRHIPVIDLYSLTSRTNTPARPFCRALSWPTT
jgi:hypothetical protein